MSGIYLDYWPSCFSPTCLTQCLGMLDFLQHLAQVQGLRHIDLLQLDGVVFVADVERLHVTLLHRKVVVGRLQKHNSSVRQQCNRC